MDELTRYIYQMDNEIITCNSNKSKDIKDIEKAIEKLKMQEKRLVDLYVNSTLDVETINHKNEVIKNEIHKLKKKIKELNPDDNFKDYTIELKKKLDYKFGIDERIFEINKPDFSSIWNKLDEVTKKEIIQKVIASLEIMRKKNYDIEIINIKFTEEFISKNTKEYLNNILKSLS